jgi:hypothetical protein
MKKLLIILVFLLVAAMLSACIPENPKDVLPYCKSIYEAQLVEHPDYPHSFIGYCVSYFQTGKSTAAVSLCGYEPFIESIGDPEITTKKDCIQYILNLEE